MIKTSLLFLFSLTLTAEAEAATFTGVITDSMCAGNHKMMNITPDAKCARECVKSAKTVKYALFDGKKTFKLSDQQTPEKYAGQKVKVTGKLYEKTGIIKTERIEPAQ